MRLIPRQGKNALGQRLCRMPNCGKLVGKGRRSYCSAECATAFEIAYFPAATRRHVFARDKGVCGMCGCDTEKIRRVLGHARKQAGRPTYCGEGRRLARQTAHDLGFNGWIHNGEFWQADHIKECVRGGWGEGLDNLRSLCTPCHKSETARLARELAEERRRANEELSAPLFQGAT